MKEILFQLAFKKAEKQSGSTTKNGLATHLENVFGDELNFPINKITFSRYYEQFMENKNSNATNPKTDLLNKLAEYLCYANYEDFVKENEDFSPEVPPVLEDNGWKKRLIILKKYWLLITIVLLILITILIVLQLNQQRWMVWNETEYKEVDFDLDKYSFNQLKVYDDFLVTHFKKIPVDCDSTEFFKPDGSANIWYQKNHNKEHEYFTMLDYHPETGKALKPISKHIIDNHICIEDSLTAQNK